MKILPPEKYPLYGTIPHGGIYNIILYMQLIQQKQTLEVYTLSLQQEQIQWQPIRTQQTGCSQSQWQPHLLGSPVGIGHGPPHHSGQLQAESGGVQCAHTTIPHAGDETFQGQGEALALLNGVAAAQPVRLYL